MNAAGSRHGPARFDGAVAVVTGGARSLGRAIAERLAAEGAAIGLVDRLPDRLDATVEEVSAAGHRVVGVVGDVTSEADMMRAHDTVGAAFGRIDVIVNNAGFGIGKRLVDITEQEWGQDVHLAGTFHCSKIFGRTLIAQGGGGAVVNMTSVVGLVAVPTRAPYAAAKAAIVALTKSAAAEWAPYGIRVNAVAPGYVETEGTRSAMRLGIIDAGAVAARTPAGRLGRPEEVAAAASFLASAEASYITGHVLVVDGGYTAYGAWWSAQSDAPGTS